MARPEWSSACQLNCFCTYSSKSNILTDFLLPDRGKNMKMSQFLWSHPCITHSDSVSIDWKRSDLEVLHLANPASKDLEGRSNDLGQRPSGYARELTYVRQVVLTPALTKLWFRCNTVPRKCLLIRLTARPSDL